MEILMFLRSVGVEWGEDVMPTIVSKGTLKMIQYARADGCPWSITGDNEYCELMLPSNDNYNVEKLKYLVDNGCPFDRDGSDRSSNALDACYQLRDLSAPECLVGKYTRFDNHTFGPFKDKPWIEGIKFAFDRGKDIARFNTIESIFDDLPNMELVKLLREQR